MGGNQAMIVAGIGCRKGCPAEAVVALVREAGAVDALAAPDWKRGEAGLLEAARVLGLPLRFVTAEALAVVQDRCVTRSAAVSRAVGIASVAEAAALAGGGKLLTPRFGGGWATCAVASSPPPLEEEYIGGDESPPPLVGGVRGGVATRSQSRCSSLQPGKLGVRGPPPPGPLPQGEGEQP